MAMAPCSRFHMKLKEFRRDGQYCDVIIRAQNQVFNCHRVVLASESEYFNSMFGSNFRETSYKEVEMHSIDPVMLETIIDYIYEFHEPTIDLSNVLDLMLTSDFLGVSQVRDSCVEFVLKNMSLMNQIETFAVACDTNNVPLIKATVNYILVRFEIEIQNDALLNLSVHNLKMLLHKYRETWIPYENENFILIALVRWIHHSYQERKKYVHELVKLVDFEKVSSFEFLEFLRKNYESASEIVDSHCNEQSTINIIHTLSQRERVDCIEAADHQVLSLPHDDLRSNIGSTFNILLRNHRRENKLEIRFKIYSKLKHNWFLSHNFTKEVYDEFTNPVVACTVLDEPNYLYCIEYGRKRGWPSLHAYSSIDLSLPPTCVLAFAPFRLDNEVTRICGLHNKSDRIYLLNDETRYDSDWTSAQPYLPEFDQNAYKRGFYCYKRDADRWLPLPNRLLKMDSSCLVACNDLVYLIGGYPNKIHHRGYVQAYDYRSSNWLKLKKSTYSYQCDSFQKIPVFCTLNETIYAFNNEHIEAFDSIAGKWRTISNEWVGDRSNSEYKMQRMVSHANKVYLFGRRGCNMICSIYDPSSEQWQHSTLMDLTSSVDGLIVEDIFIFNTNK